MIESFKRLETFEPLELKGIVDKESFEQFYKWFLRNKQKLMTFELNFCNHIFHEIIWR